MNTGEYKKNNSVTLLKGGSAYFEILLKLINETKELIYIQTYIFANDYTGNLIADSLINATKRNVRIYIMIDGIASNNLPKQFISKLTSAGIKFRYFEPIFKSKFLYFGRRMHQKVIVTDTKNALVGGLNIADKYNDRPEKKAWLDFAVLVKGDVVTEIEENCKQIWQTFTFVNKETRRKSIQKSEFLSDKNCDVRVRINDWVWHQNEISNSYIEILHTAKKQVVILCSYFIPGKAFRRQIINAVKRGIKIKIIIAGKSDVILAKNAEKWLYDWLLRNHIHLYEYQNNILHGKIAICDTTWLTIGSYNINNISTYASVEVNLDIRNDDFTEGALSKIENIIEQECIKITKENHLKSKNIFIQFRRWLSYQTIRILFFISTFYFKRKS